MNAENTALLMQAGPSIFRRPEPRMPFALFYFECGDGWFDLLLHLAQQLEALAQACPATDLDEKVYVVQVKEKYGTLRFYISHGTDKMYELIDEAERKSAVTCETCGAPGKVQGRGWLRCSCEECAKS